MKLIKPVAASIAVVASLGLAAPATAKISLKVSPKSPIVDDNVTVSWRTDRNLKPGYHYSASLVTPLGTDCAGLVFKDSKRKPRKGKPMSFTFSPYDDELNGSSEWCQGKATVSVSIVKDGSERGNMLDIVSFRFLAKP